MGEILSFSKPARLGGQVRNVPFNEVTGQVARLLALHTGDSLEIQLRFHMNGQVTLIIGWPEPELMHLPYDSGSIPEFEDTLRLIEQGIAKGIEENPALVTFYKAEANEPASWSIVSEESVKFPLRDEDL